MTHHNRADVDRRLKRLQDAYDPLVERKRVSLSPSEFESFVDRANEGYTGGGYAWVVRSDPPPLSESMPEVDEPYPKVLLALGRGDDGWGPAGGGREDGETYEEATEREVTEATGIECEVVDCRRVEHATLRSAAEGERDTVHTLWAYFVARATGGTLRVDESELDGAAWFRDPPERLQWGVRGHPWTWEAWP